MGVTLMLVWDYDSAAGMEASYLSRQADPLSDYTCTERILELLARHGIVSTFACVGRAAEPGPLPYHNPAQIRAIHDAGHEIASHSHGHELIPSLNRKQLLETLRTSKAALEDCIGEEVIGFVPPWNRPFHYPRKFSISWQDWRAGGGRWKQSVVTLCQALRECGYRWVRVRYSGMREKVYDKVRPSPNGRITPLEVETYHGVVAFRLGYLGYDDRLIEWLASDSYSDRSVVIYAHPHGIEHANSQNWRYLSEFAAWFAAHGKSYGISFMTPKAWLKMYPIRR